jgi:type II secretory pathway component PulC
VVAARAGQSLYTGDSLQLGDVIYSVNTVPVTSIEALRSAIDVFKDTDPLVLQVERNGRLLYVTMAIE